MIAKRAFDLFLVLPALIMLLPFLVLIAAWIKIDSPGPVFFRQERVGRGGQLFRIFKFRTMKHARDEAGMQLTVGADRRITRVGAMLRRYKIDELPQLINVALGQMSLVGPRPEVPHYVAFYPEDVRWVVLSTPPGITDWASINYFSESDLLSASPDPERTYIEEILPVKLSYYVDYVRKRSLAVDVRIIVATLVRIGSSR